MTDTIFDQDDTLTFRLRWPTICAMACRALIEGHTFDSLVEAALDDYLQKEKTKCAPNP